MRDVTEAIEEVRVLRPEPGDVMVLRLAEPASPELRNEILGEISTLFPLNKCVLLGPGESWEVIRGTQDGPVPSG
jgi:hypothetical protein